MVFGGLVWSLPANGWRCVSVDVCVRASFQAIYRIEHVFDMSGY